MNFDSKEELYFHWWIEELKNKGLILHYEYQPKPFILSDNISLKCIKQLKTKTKEEKLTLISGHSYQADFLIYWDKTLKERLFINYKEIIKGKIKQYPMISNYSEKRDCFFSVIDVKGNYNQNDAWRRFSIDQKWVFQKFNIYVQKIITHPRTTKAGKLIPANSLFTNTFVPNRFLTTDANRTYRKINYSFQNIDEYLLSFDV